MPSAASRTARSRRPAVRSVAEVLAAVDLGSNSFHMVVAKYSHGQLVIIDRLREMVRLAAGVEVNGQFEHAAAARAIACLERFGQRLRAMRAGTVRAVGTSALRVAHSKEPFLARARAALGHPIEIISGREEARLIYAGVAATLPREPSRRLIVDIGGGSTELIIGRGLIPLELESVRVGCVVLSERHFADGKISSKRMAAARLSVRQQLEPLRRTFQRRGWQVCAGSSGTVRAIGEAIRELNPRANVITAHGIERLVDRVVAAGHTRELRFWAVTEDRRPVFPGGLAILAEVFAVFGVKEMRVADGALREGLLYDMVGRYTDGDARERTVHSMQQRYHVDVEQAEQVAATALQLLRGVRAAWKLGGDPQVAWMLKWAACLHEIGLDVAHSGYHRHGAYLLENADMPGFSRSEQRLLARLVGAHRRKLVRDGLAELAPPWDRRALHLIVLLRLAVLLHRGRGRAALPRMRVSAAAGALRLVFPARWLANHPLTQADLRQEVQYLRAAGFTLRVPHLGR